MTPEQKQKVIKIIQKDATLRGKYVCGNDCCVIGGLLLAVGFDREKLEQVNSMGIIYDFRFFLVKGIPEEIILDEMRTTLQTEYGINLELADRLQVANDCFLASYDMFGKQLDDCLVPKRRAHLIELINHYES